MPPKGHHFIPRLHLQHFVGNDPKGQVWTYDAQTGRVWSAIPEWRGEIKEALARAKAAVLFVSPYFLESDFIAEHELPPLLDAAKEEGLVILWVYISHCLYDETEIEHYQAANEISKPLDSLTPSEQNRVLVDVCRKIKAAVNPKSPSQAGEPNAAAENEASRAYRRDAESPLLVAALCQLHLFQLLRL